MLIPLISFVLGVIILLYAVLVYGTAFFREVPEHLKKKDLLAYLIGYTLIAIALCLGLPGYLEHTSAVVLRPVRLVTGISGLIILFYQYIEVLSRP
jgi:hypothetical protein